MDHRRHAGHANCVSAGGHGRVHASVTDASGHDLEAHHPRWLQGEPGEQIAGAQVSSQPHRRQNGSTTATPASCPLRCSPGGIQRRNASGPRSPLHVQPHRYCARHASPPPARARARAWWALQRHTRPFVPIAAVAKLCKIGVASSRADDLARNGCHDAMGLAVLYQILATRPRKVRHVPAKARHVPAKARRREPCREYRRRLRGDAGPGSGVLTRMEQYQGRRSTTILGPGRARATILGPLSRRLTIPDHPAPGLPGTTLPLWENFPRGFQTQKVKLWASALAVERPGSAFRHSGRNCAAVRGMVGGTG